MSISLATKGVLGRGIGLATKGVIYLFETGGQIPFVPTFVIPTQTPTEGLLLPGSIPTDLPGISPPKLANVTRPQLNDTFKPSFIPSVVSGPLVDADDVILIDQSVHATSDVILSSGVGEKLLPELEVALIKGEDTED